MLTDSADWTWAHDSVNTRVLMPNLARLVGVKPGADLESVVPSGEEKVGMQPHELLEREIIRRDVTDLA